MRKARCTGDNGATSASMICVDVSSLVIASNFAMFPVHLVLRNSKQNGSAPVITPPAKADRPSSHGARMTDEEGHQGTTWHVI